MGSEERQKEEGLGNVRRATRRTGLIPPDIAQPYQDKRSGVSAPPVPPGVIRTQEAPSDVISGNTVQITVTNISQPLLPADPRRKFLFIQNNDALGSVNIAFGVDATNATGMKLSANGGGILLDNNVPTAAIFVIGSIASNSNVTMIYA